MDATTLREPRPDASPPPTRPHPALVRSGDRRPAILTLDLGATTGWALRGRDGKLARLGRHPADLDSVTDVAGYAACLREILR